MLRDIKEVRESMGGILEGLNRKTYMIDEEVEYSFIRENIEYLPILGGYGDIPIDEAKAVVFGKKAYPTEGWAIILSGGSGSGKGYVLGHQILISGKIFDVDELKRLYAKASETPGTLIGKETGGRKYDFKNSDDVADLHIEIGNRRGFDTKSVDNFFNANAGKKPNVIFDITGKSWSKLINIGKMCKDLGYKTALVWVVANREVAMIRNLMRDRTVTQEVFHSIHNQVKETLTHFIKSEDAKNYDEVWIVFSEQEGLNELSKEQKKAYLDNSSFQLKKAGNSFDLPSDLEEKIYRFLGPDELTPENPSIYKNYDEVKKQTEPFITTETDAKGKKKTELKGYGQMSFLKANVDGKGIK